METTKINHDSRDQKTYNHEIIEKLLQLWFYHAYIII